MNDDAGARGMAEAAPAGGLHEAYFGHQRVTVIEPDRGWRMLDLRELWAYRELLWTLIVRDVKVRYKQTALGVSWAILRPLVTLAIFSVIFGSLAKLPSDGYPYPVFVFAGLLPWTFFAHTLGASAQSLLGSAQLINKVYFPRLIIPFSTVGVGVVDLAINMALLVPLLAFYGIGPTLNLLALPALLVMAVFTVLGVGTLCAALTVAYRDVAHVLPFLVQVGMYLTPVIYPIDFIPEPWRWWLGLNPLTGLIEGFRAALLGKSFAWVLIAQSVAISTVLLVWGVAYFERVERRFADVI